LSREEDISGAELGDEVKELEADLHMREDRTEIGCEDDASLLEDRGQHEPAKITESFPAFEIPACNDADAGNSSRNPSENGHSNWPCHESARCLVTIRQIRPLSERRGSQMEG
jgi:hypothetical protein